ncbi:MAG: O-antigen ligase family protein [Bacteroidota bacterium]
MSILSTTNKDRQTFHFWVYFILLCLLAASMPTSIYMVSVVQIGLGVNWLLEGRYKDKFNKFFNNKPAIVFTLIYVMHLVGLLWTEDLMYALGSDLKHKLPTLTLTLIIVSSHEIDIKKIRIILYLFVASVIAVSFISFANYLINDITNHRKILMFSYHLYFNLMLVLSMFLLPYLVRKSTKNKAWFVVSLLLSLWMLYFLILTRALSSLAALSAVIVFILVYIFFKKHSIYIKIVSASLLIVGIVFSVMIVRYVNQFESTKTEVSVEALETHTKEGNPYKHFLPIEEWENGNPVYIYIAEDELQDEWNNRSDIDYYSTDKKGYDIRFTLFRYLTSKGLRKDREGLQELTDEDIKAVEQGITNHLYTEWPGILERIHQTIKGIHIYNETNNPNWSTLTQRIDLWKASYEAFKKKPIFGWGTGDLFIAVEYGLEKNDSVLQGEKMKPHSQYLLFLLTLGSVGLILFFVFYIYPVVKTKAYKIFPFKVFMIAYAINMIGNNPIDAQLGQTMFVFFTLVFCFMYPKE